MALSLSTVQRALVLAAALFCSVPSSIWAAESSEPINIEANRMVSQENENSVVFLGKVEAKQGKLTIRSDEMTVFYADSKNGKEKKTSTQMDKLICKNNVQITQEDWLGTGDRMDYFAKERKVILSGNAKAWQGQNMVAGKTIVYYLDEKRSIVEQDETTKGRVKAVLHPEGKK